MNKVKREVTHIEDFMEEIKPDDSLSDFGTLTYKENTSYVDVDNAHEIKIDDIEDGETVFVNQSEDAETTDKNDETINKPLNFTLVKSNVIKNKPPEIPQSLKFKIISNGLPDKSSNVNCKIELSEPEHCEIDHVDSDNEHQSYISSSMNAENVLYSTVEIASKSPHQVEHYFTLPSFEMRDHIPQLESSTNGSCNKFSDVSYFIFFINLKIT